MLMCLPLHRTRSAWPSVGGFETLTTLGSFEMDMLVLWGHYLALLRPPSCVMALRKQGFSGSAGDDVCRFHVLGPV